MMTKNPFRYFFTLGINGRIKVTHPITTNIIIKMKNIIKSSGLIVRALLEDWTYILPYMENSNAWDFEIKRKL